VKPGKGQNKKKNSKGSILYISYFFPPAAGGGVFRPLATVKYLSRLGWDITVLAAKDPPHHPTDPELLDQVPISVKIHREKVVWEGSFLRRLIGRLGLAAIPKHLITPDERVFWAEKAATRAKKLVSQNSFDLIYTTGPPYSILLLGLWLSRELKLPWVAEFRDPWTFAPYVPLLNANQRRFARETEEDILDKASAVIMVTETYKKRMMEMYPENGLKVFSVPNGFDEEEFDGIRGKHFHKNEKFTILISGTIFGKGKSNLDELFVTLRAIKGQNREQYSRMRVVIQGLPDSSIMGKILDLGLADICDSRGFVSHKENIHDLFSADLLILPMAPTSEKDIHIPSRTYEYLACGTPMIVICPDSELSQLVEPFGQVTRLNPGDQDDLKSKILEYFGKYENGVSEKQSDSVLLSGHTRKHRTSEIEAILNKVLGRNPGG
jgi:glycosyltransferase involved in cell wall biosynthesis